MMHGLQNIRLKFLVTILLLAGLLLSLSTIVWASGGNAGDRSGDILDLIYRILNFTLMVIIIYVIVKKASLKDFFTSRVKGIRQRLEDLKKGKEDAEREYLEIGKKLNDFEEEKKKIIDQFQKEGLAEKERIISEAKERVKQIIENAELTVQQEIQSARDSLRQEIVEHAAQRAQEIIEQRMKDKDQDLLVNEFIERVGKLH